MTPNEIVGGLTVATSGAVLALALHLLLWRLPLRKRADYRLLLLLFALGYLFAVTIASWTGLDPLRHAPLSVSISLMYLLFYLHIYSGLLRSVSVLMLEALHKASGNGLTTSELGAHCSGRNMLRDRIEGMERAGLVQMQDGAVACTPKGCRLARISLFFAGVFNIRATG